MGKLERAPWSIMLVVMCLASLVGAVVCAPPMAAAATWTVQDDGVQDAPPAAPAGGAASAPQREERTLLSWLRQALGWLYITVFIALSFVLVALFIMNVLSARRDAVCPPALVEGFEALLDEKKYQDAYELAKADESFLGNVLSSGLAKLNMSYSHAVEAMQEVGQEESMKLQHRLSYLALIGTLSPMIGLFGTVDGMIRSFFTIAMGGGSPDPNKLADGISKALLTTLIGLAIAIPAIAAYNILRNRFERLELEVGITSDNLMSRFEKVGAKKEG
ncbi:MAG TPA: MotA/TolQ/ExbB proton channel family protein [Pirellulaceae bacterium]|nr:MotA/TolQ/ExbB proton channel family protein [Pirellulaceae bacterium]